MIPDDTPAGAISLTYNMVGCNGSANGNLLPIQAGPTSTSCPEQTAFVPFPGFFPPGGMWSGPGILPSEEESGLYDPSLLADGQWAPLVYLAPNGCTDTLWMFNRQTAVDPSVMHVCRGEDRNVLDEDEVGASPWCGTWTALDAGSATAMGVRMGTLDVVPAHRHFAGHLFGQHLHRHPVDCRAPGLLGPVALERLPGRWPVGIAGDPARRNLEWRWGD